MFSIAVVEKMTLSAAPAVLMLRIETPRPLPRAERQRLERWLAVREGRRQVLVDYAPG